MRHDRLAVPGPVDARMGRDCRDDHGCFPCRCGFRHLRPRLPLEGVRDRGWIKKAAHQLHPVVDTIIVVIQIILISHPISIRIPNTFLSIQKTIGIAIINNR